VDETDVAKLKVGQRAYVTRRPTAVANSKAHYPCGPDSGKKNVRTDEPTEHVDTKILETLLELNAGEKLPLGLRVESYVVLNR